MIVQVETRILHESMFNSELNYYEMNVSYSSLLDRTAFNDNDIADKGEKFIWSRTENMC